jgi:hypothetical protein
MPFRDYKSFDLDTLRNMTDAYDVALARLKIRSDDPLTSKLAAWIAAFASEGERDPIKLCEKALAALKPPRKTWKSKMTPRFARLGFGRFQVGQRVIRKTTEERGTVVEFDGGVKVQWDGGGTSYFRGGQKPNVRLPPK